MVVQAYNCVLFCYYIKKKKTETCSGPIRRTTTTRTAGEVVIVSYLPKVPLKIALCRGVPKINPILLQMYYDLYLPFPLPPSQEDTNSKKAKKGKGKAPLPPPAVSRADCWDGLETSARESVAKRIALTGHCE